MMNSNIYLYPSMYDLTVSLIEFADALKRSRSLLLAEKAGCQANKNIKFDN